MSNDSSDWSDVVAQAAESYQQIAQMIITQQNAEQARADQKWYYEDQKNWNSPAYQMLLRSQAGINPYSDFSIGTASVPQPVNLADSYNQMFNSMFTSADSAKRRKLDRLTYELTLQQLDLEKDKLSSEKDLLEERKKLTHYQGLGVELDNYLKNALMSNKIDISQYETLIKSFDALYAPDNAFYDSQSRRYQSDIDYYNSLNSKSQYEDFRPLLLDSQRYQSGIDYYDYLTSKRQYEDFLPLLLDQLENDVKVSGFDSSQIEALDSAIKKVESPVLQTILRIVLMAAKNANQSSWLPSILRPNKSKK